MLLHKIETLFMGFLNILTKYLADKIGRRVVVDCGDFILPRHQQSTTTTKIKISSSGSSISFCLIVTSKKQGPQGPLLPPPILPLPSTGQYN
jgi:hypothetical protein